MKNYMPLDLPRLKHDLVILPNDSKVMLLKALRWVRKIIIMMIGFLITCMLILLASHKISAWCC